MERYCALGIDTPAPIAKPVKIVKNGLGAGRVSVACLTFEEQGGMMRRQQLRGSPEDFQFMAFAVAFDQLNKKNSKDQSIQN